MLSIAVPASLKSLVIAQVPEALVIACSETANGTIAELPLDLTKYDAIVFGPGLTLEAAELLVPVLATECPLVLDADGLNGLAHLNLLPRIAQRNSPTILTPHLGEFRRLFPAIASTSLDRLELATRAAKSSGTIVLFKGARTIIAAPDGTLWCLVRSSAALARGGSGDVLAGILGGLIAQTSAPELTAVVATGAWWHAEAALLAAEERTELGVDPLILTKFLAEIPRLSEVIMSK
jgi:NAD(P)H-hydrate epimerase